jgi:hypothetical protein
MLDFDRIRKDDPEAFYVERIPGFVKMGKPVHVNDAVLVEDGLTKLRKTAPSWTAKHAGETELEWQGRLKAVHPKLHGRIEGTHEILEVW